MQAGVAEFIRMVAIWFGVTVQSMSFYTLFLLKTIQIATKRTEG